MSSDWPITEISEVCSVGDGAHSKVTRQATGIPYLTSKNIGRGQIKSANIDFISADDYDRLFPLASKATRRPQAGDLLIGIIGTFGNAYLYKSSDHFGFSSSIGILRPDKNRLIPEYLYYAVTSPKFQIVHENHNAGSAQGYTNIPTVKKLKLPLPPIEAQKQIAEILSALDDRITLLRETNATLEAIAQALFKSWFVDFDPVHAKQQGRAPEGMDEATAALFPDSFEESELGLVPKGWRAGTLADFATLNAESWTVKKHPATVAYIDLANAKDNEIAEVTDYLFEEAPSRARRVLRSGDTIVGTVRPGNRSFAFIHEPAKNLTASTGFAVLRPTVIQNTEFVYLGATQDSSIEHLAHVADGGAYPAVRPDVVLGLPCIVPSDGIMQAFHDVAASLLASVAENQRTAQTLATLRDTLLPRLISGQLRLPEAESAVTATL